jgi:hypothetical protein
VLHAGIFKAPSAGHLFEVLGRVHDRLAAAEEGVYNAERLRLEDAYAHVSEQLQRAEEDEGKLADDIQTVEAEMRQGERKLSESRAALSEASTQLRAARTSYPSRWFAHRVRELVTLEADLAQHRVELEKRLTRHEMEMLDLAKQRRDANKDEFERRAKVYEERYNAADSRFRELDNHVADLRRIGVTRQIAGYMVWAGYLGFAAFGWFLGVGLEQAIGDALVEGPTVLHVLLSGMGAFTARYGVIVALAAAALSPLVLVVVAAGIRWLVSRVLHGERFGRRSKVPRREPFVDAGIFLPRFPWNRAGTADGTVPSVAYLPTLYLWIALPLVGTVLLGQLPVELTEAAAARALNSFLLTYFGVVCAVATAGLCLVYVARVAEPRARILLRSPNVTRHIFAAHIEVVILLGCIAAAVVVLLGRAALGEYSALYWQPSSTLAALFFMLVNGVVVAHGTIYRGLFKDYDAIKAESGELWRVLEQHRAWPTIRGDDEESANYAVIMKQLDDRIAELWRNVDKDWEDGGPLRSTWLSDGAARVDIVLEPHLASAWNQAAQTLRRTEAEVAALRANLGDLRLRMAGLRTTELRQRAAVARSELEARRFKHEREMAALDQSYQLLKLECETALAIGRTLSGTIALSGV